MNPAPHHGPTALLAEDEPLLAAALQAELAKVWPELRVLATVGDGHSAVTQALALQPDVVFMDIRMPGQTGLEAAAELADAWPERGARPFPALVFVTAYDHYACQAFDLQAVDYVLKPVQRTRLAQTVARLRSLLASPAPWPGEQPTASAANVTGAAASAPTAGQLAQLAALLQQTGLLAPEHPSNTATTAGASAGTRLSVIPASVGSGTGSTLVMVPVAEVLYFEAADKYVRVITPEREVLIRTPLKELLPQLDPQQFWQVHRGTLVRANAIERVSRDDAGKLWLHLRQRPERLAISRLYAHVFKAM